MLKCHLRICEYKNQTISSQLDARSGDLTAEVLNIQVFKDVTLRRWERRKPLTWIAFTATARSAHSQDLVQYIFKPPFPGKKKTIFSHYRHKHLKPRTGVPGMWKQLSSFTENAVSFVYLLIYLPVQNRVHSNKTSGNMMCFEVCVLRPCTFLWQMNVYGAWVEWYWQGKIKALGKKACPRAIQSTTDPKGGSKWHNIRKGQKRMVSLSR